MGTQSRGSISAALRFPTEWAYLGRGIRGDAAVKTQGMTRAQVEAALAHAGLDIPERERAEIGAAAHFIDEMAERVRGRREMTAEPAHIFPPPEP
jgi:hypothetical protein